MLSSERATMLWARHESSPSTRLRFRLEGENVRLFMKIRAQLKKPKHVIALENGVFQWGNCAFNVI